MAVTRIKNNQITDAVNGNVQPGINAAAKLQNYSITSTKIANSLVYGSDLTVSGNLTVNGTTTTIDTVNTLIEDPIITLADGQTSGTPVVDIGLLGLRGSQDSSFLGWNEGNTEFAAVLSNTTASNTTVNINSYANFHANSIIAGGNLSVAGNVTGALNLTGTLTAGNLATPGTVSATGTATLGNVATGGTISATGTATVGNVATAGTVSATGTITGGNIATGGTVSATGTATLGNVDTGGTISATGNITGGNINFGSGVVSGTGNIYANTIFANISGNIDAAGSNTQIQYNGAGDQLAANANFTYDYATNLMTVNGGNIATGNLSATGLVSVVGNVFAPAIIANSSTYDTRLSLNSAAGIVEITTNGNSTQFTPSGQINLSGVSTIAGGTFTGSGFTAGTSQTDLFQNRGGNVTVQVGTGGSIANTWTFAQGGSFLAPGAISTVGNITTPATVNANTLNGTSVSILSNGLLTLSTTGNITASGAVINNVGTPVQNGDAANKQYVDEVAQGLDIKASVTLTSVANLSPYTYSNGTSGVGATLTAQANGALSLDSTATTANARVLIKNEVGAYVDPTTQSAAFNGIYIVTQTGNATAPYILTRSTDFDNGSPSGEIPGAFTFVEYGSTAADTGWVCTTNAPVTVGTTQITWAQFSGAGSYTAGNALSLAGTQFNVNIDTSGNATVGINGSNELYIPTGAKLTNPNITNATGTSLSVTGNITGGDVYTGGTVSATGNVTGGNVLTGGLVSATGTATAGNLATGGTVSATGTITGGNIATGGTVSATGTATVGNLATGGTVSATGNATVGNVYTAYISASGNIDTSANINQTGTGNINGYNGYFSNSVTVIANLYTSGNVVAINSGIFYGDSVTGNGAIYAGIPGYTVLGSNVVTQFAGNVNSYSQVNFQNINSGNLASTDYIATADDGDDDNYYIDIGINSSTFDDPTNYPGFFAHDSYVHNHGGNLIINPETAGTTIKLMVGGTDTTDVIANISNTGFAITGVVSATGNVTGANVIGVTGGYFGNIVISGDDITDTNGRVNFNTAVADVDFAVNGLAANVFYVDAGANTASFGNSSQITNALVTFNTTTSIKLPVGTLGQRPGTGVTGMMRFNTTDNALEIYNNSEWQTVGSTIFTVIADEQFNGDGSTVAFTLASSQTTNSCIVSINGIVQIPGSAYSVSGVDPACVLTFTEAPAAGDLIDVRELTTTTTVTALANGSGNAEITGSATSAAFNITGNLIPTANLSYSLGNSTNYWSTLYVGGNTIYLGGLQLQSSTGNVFSVTTDGSTPASINATFTGTVSTAGNVTGANILTGGLISAAGNITGGNIITGGAISATGNIYGNVYGIISTDAILNSGANGTGNIGNATNYFNTVFAKATSAQYADLAEKYVADAAYAPGTVVSFGGDKEVTVSVKDADRAVAGVVSTNPSYIMNATLEAEYVATVAFTGRVPTSVTGTVSKGDLMVSNGDGTARAEQDPKAGAIIGKALENFAGGTGTIEVVIGRF